jgi:hypothetical protein
MMDRARKRAQHSERVERTVVHPAELPAHLSRILELQQRAGNRAVGRLLSRQSKPPPQGPVISAPSQPMSRSEFERALTSRFGVKKVTSTDWDPGDPAELYRSIADAFQDFASALGGTPKVDEIVFRKADPSTPGEAADFQAGRLTVYSLITSAYWWLPLDRSAKDGKYAATSGGTIRVHGGTPGAPIPLPTVATSERRIIVHELGHGVVEGMLTPGEKTPALDKDMIKDFAKAVGWFDGQLYDIGDPAVARALGSDPPQRPTATPITKDDWNDPKWSEQPVGDYPLVGPHEDFPQSLMAYIYAPELLKRRSPRRYAFFEQRKGSWTPILKPPSQASSSSAAPVLEGAQH